MFKVVFKSGYKLYSCCLNDFIVDNDLKVEYELDEWTYPKLAGSKLFVFDNLESAQHMISRYNWEYSHKIYKCKVKNPISVKIDQGTVLSSYDVWNNYIEQKKKKKKITWVFGSHVPDGTYLCSAVKLIGDPV